MKNIISLMLTLLFLASCTSSQHGSELYESYSVYKKETNHENISERADEFFSPSLLGPDYQTDSDAISQLLFKNYMAKVKSHYESINKSQGCLTINGVDAEGQPLLISLKYIKKKGMWLIDDIHLSFLERESHFFQYAACPNALPN